MFRRHSNTNLAENQDEFRYDGRVSSFCSSTYTSHVIRVINLVNKKSYSVSWDEQGKKNGILTRINGANSWSTMTKIFHNGLPRHVDGHGKTFKIMTSNLLLGIECTWYSGIHDCGTVSLVVFL